MKKVGAADIPENPVWPVRLAFPASRHFKSLRICQLACLRVAHGWQLLQTYSRMGKPAHLKMYWSHWA